MGETGGIDLAATLRALRRRADLSQRQLAELAGVPKCTVTRIESGTAVDPRVRTVERLFRAAGAELAVSGGVDPVPAEELRDRAERHYPAHLDVRPVEELTDWAGAWWAHWHRLPREMWPLEPPEHTFDLSRARRARRRQREAVRQTFRVRRSGDCGTRVGEVWRWVAETAEGELVGEVRAVVRAGHPEEPPGTREVFLDGVVVADGLRGLGIGRRLVGEFAAEVERSGVAVARAVVGAGAAGRLPASVRLSGGLLAPGRAGPQASPAEGVTRGVAPA